ncbi:MAG: GNAT family N-acetyltransferase [Paracoccaceae bacterium]
MVRVVVPEPDIAARLCTIEQAAFPGREAHWSVDDYVNLGGPPGAAILTDDAIAKGLLVLQFAADEGEVINLGVIPQARRHGLGRELLDAGEALADGLGIARIYLEVAADNAPARKLYEAAGYARVGERKDYYARPDGNRMDTIVMSRSRERMAP